MVFLGTLFGVGLGSSWKFYELDDDLVSSSGGCLLLWASSVLEKVSKIG